MKKTLFAISVSIVAVFAVCPAISKPISDINAKVAQLDIDTATLEDVIRIFGEPTEYVWAGQTYTKSNLPRVYIARYPDDFAVVIISDKISELRFESSATGYIFRDKIQVDSSLNEVLEVVGRPTKTVRAKPNKFEDGVLYKDIDGEKGYCYYSRADPGGPIFLRKLQSNKALYDPQQTCCG